MIGYDHIACEECEEPTKTVGAFWDGHGEAGNPTNGIIWTCKSAACPVALRRREMEAAEEARREQVHEVNVARGIDVRELRRLRVKARCTTMDASKLLCCGPAQYSAYETEKEPLPRHLYDHHPDLWAKMLELQALPNKATELFNREMRFSDIDSNFRMDDAQLSFFYNSWPRNGT